MGTWSHEPFGNDTANDWAAELEGTKDFLAVERAIQNVLDEDPGYLDADVAAEAIAASEVLAKALGRGTQSDAYTEEVDQWLKTITAAPSPDLLAKARTALARVLAPDSELRELWEESDDFESWQASITTLQAALAK